MKITALLTLLLTLALSTLASAQDLERLPSTSRANHYRLVDGDRRFDIDLPKATAPSDGFPLIVVLPGLGVQTEDHEKIRSRLVREGYMVATFEWKENEDYDADDWDDEIAELTDDLLAEDRRSGGALRGKIDEDRLGLLGHSLGASVAVLTAARDRRFKALAISGPGGRQTDFLRRARDLQIPVIAVDGSLDHVAPPDEASGVILERAQTPYKAHIVIKNGNHRNSPADYDSDYVLDEGRWSAKPIPFWPFVTYSWTYPKIEGLKPIPGADQRKIAFPYIVGWFDRFVAGKSEDPSGLANGERAARELASGKLTRGTYSAAARSGSTTGLAGAVTSD